jgi:glycosyltransferase involved in cell wall biosynthesis
LKILHIITTIERGGAEKQLVTLVRAQLLRGHEVSVFYLKGNPDLKSTLESIGIKVIGTSYQLTSFLLFFKDYRKFLHDKDLMHAHLPAAEILAALFGRKMPLVISRHNAQPFFPKNKFISHLLTRLVEKRAQACIAISRAVRDYELENQNWLSPNTISVVYYGLELKAQASKNVIAKTGPLNFLFIGRLVPQKDVPCLLKGFQVHLRQFPADTLTIVGKGYLEKELKEFCKKLQISSSVNWLGQVDDVNSLYANYDVFVLTSLYEGFGLVLLEALSFGIPILAPNNSAIPEVLGKDHGAFFATRDHEELASLMNKMHDYQFRKLLIARQNQRKKAFEADKMVDSVLQVYLSAISRYRI